MTQFLVFTAVGTDRTGIVSEITELASDFGCNIVDSRMAILGNEFTLIMLLSGKRSAINQFETRLPLLAHSLQLLTISKRTSEHEPKFVTKYLEVKVTSKDTPGILKDITRFFAKRNMDLSSLKSISCKDDSAQINLSIDATTDVNTEQLNQDFQNLCQQLQVKGEIFITTNPTV
ncbi:glycine cleavage system protein R [Thalassotalea aquiviva]|uniref:glycine cleavage system protein R n=1 Tax=Thalassotalea aquiviva TaxID=3242415 RepID=UPI00352B10A8